MKCPSCAAETSSSSKFCEYCGCELPREKEPAPTNNIVDNHQTIVNNYYVSSAPKVTIPSSTVSYNIPTYKPKSKTFAILLCIFFGYFGAHYFYVGKAGMGILYLFTMGLFGFGWFIDIFRIAFNKFKDKNGWTLN